jgi:hypothetical protein
MLADVLRTDGHRFRPLSPMADEIKALRALVRGRDDLVPSLVRCSLLGGRQYLAEAARKAVSLLPPFGQRTCTRDKAPLFRAPLLMPDGIQGRGRPLIPRTRWSDAEPCRVHLLKW